MARDIYHKTQKSTWYFQFTIFISLHQGIVLNTMEKLQRNPKVGIESVHDDKPNQDNFSSIKMAATTSEHFLAALENTYFPSYIERMPKQILGH